MPKPAPYPPKDAEERRAVDVLRYLLSSPFVKADLHVADKIPNHDGEIELVDDESRPIGSLRVQVRKLPDGFDGKYSKCETGWIAYAKTNPSQPFLLIGVDITTERAYWVQITPEMESEIKEEQKTFTHAFDLQSNVIEKGNELYLAKWRELVLRPQERLRTIKDESLSDEVIRLGSFCEADRTTFRRYVDVLNNLLGFDFKRVKDEYFLGIDRIGMAVIHADPDSIYYLHYATLPGTTTPTVISLKEQAEEIKFFEIPSANYLSDIVKDTSVTAISSVGFTRRSYFDPEKRGREFVFKLVQEALDHRIFTPCHRALCVEEIFAFVDRFKHTCGLPASDRYTVLQLNEAIFQFLPVWFHLNLERWIQQSGLTNFRLNVFDGLALTNPIDPLQIRNQIGKINSFASTAILTYSRVRYIIQALEYLSSKGVVEISRPYPPLFKMKEDQIHFAPSDLQVRIKSVINSAAKVYRQFVMGNQLPGLADAPYVGDLYSYCFVPEAESFLEGRIVATQYKLEDPEQELGKLRYIDPVDYSACIFNDKDWRNPTASINGKEYKVVSFKRGYFPHLNSDVPLKDQIYDMLASDINHVYKIGLGFRAKDSTVPPD